ncbi:MAG: efflux RND transporter periplasmic adaptor subunit [Opitutaceae bacterium]
MNKKLWILLIATGAVALVAGMLLERMWSSGPAPEHGHDHATTSAAQEASVIWTCSMHPQIQRSEPGACPICGMDLIPLIEDDSADEGPRVLTMSASAMALADIATTTVIRAVPEVEVRLVGKLDYDETRLKSLTARFPARIERLFVNYTGIEVRKGDHLAEIYSPELLMAQRELLAAVQFDPGGVTAEIAREKLRLWDLLPEQIEGIVKSGEARDHFELRAPIGGVVVQKNVKEGDYVKTGDTLFRIADLSTLWLPLEAFETDLQWLRYGQTVTFEVEAFPGEAFEGRIVFIDPVLNERTRTVGVRVEVANPSGLLKPGMFAEATVFSQIASGGRVISPELAGKWMSPMHPEIVKDGPGQCDVCGMDLVPVESLGYEAMEEGILPLLVPTSAVLRTGRRAVVYVAMPDRERPTFEGREITLGPRAGDVFLVLDGLEEGDEVVTNGAFKIDSALQILARPSMMNPTGGGPVPGHDHGAATAAQPEDVQMGNAMEAALSSEETLGLLEHYFDLQAALAADEPDAAKAALVAMLETVGHRSSVADLLHQMLEADDLAGMRRPYFDRLSSMLIVGVREHPKLIDQTLFLKHCPMVYPDHGADWLQTDEATQNPYFGGAMLYCGETVETLTVP